MRIRHIQITNFRGISNLEWAVPDTKLLCLIGRGDCCKTSIMEAIRLALYPSWNPTIIEFDFFNGNTSASTKITVTLGNLESGLLKWQKYGQHLREWNPVTQDLSDEPGERHDEVLSVRLTVDESLDRMQLQRRM